MNIIDWAKAYSPLAVHKSDTVAANNIHDVFVKFMW